MSEQNPQIDDMADFLDGYRHWTAEDWRHAFVGAHTTCEYFKAKIHRLTAERDKALADMNNVILESLIGVDR